MPNWKRNAASQVGNTGKTHGKCGGVPNFIAYFGHFWMCWASLTHAGWPICTTRELRNLGTTLQCWFIGKGTRLNYFEIDVKSRRRNLWNTFGWHPSNTACNAVGTVKARCLMHLIPAFHYWTKWSKEQQFHKFPCNARVVIISLDNINNQHVKGNGSAVKERQNPWAKSAIAPANKLALGVVINPWLH